MLLTFEIMSQVKGISFCREMRKFEGSHLCIYKLQWQIQGRARPPPLFLHQTEARRDEKKYFCDCSNLPTYRGVASNLVYRGS